MKRYFLLIIVVFLLIIPIVNSDVISINSGGSNHFVINPNNYLEGFFFMSDLLRILYTTFNGSTTDFNILAIDSLNNLSGTILEKISYGKVSFNENLNLTAIASSDRIVDFDSDLNISQNLIYIDNSDLPYINKSATLILRNLNFSNPQIMKGGAICSDCVFLSYSGKNLTFTTQTFYGAYYARETPLSYVCGNGICEDGEDPSNCAADCTGSSGGGGGGGGGGSSSENVSGYDFKVLPEIVTVKMSKGQYYQENLFILNNGTKTLNIEVSVSNLENFIFPEENNINLRPGENKTLRLNIYVSETKPADVYVGKILFKAKYISANLSRVYYVERSSRAILDIKDKNALFDIKTNILKRYINPGGKIAANISIINMGDLRNFDVSLEYMIIDFDKKNYSLKKEDFAMNKTYNGIYYLDIPKNIRMGDYIFYSKVSSGNISASSYDTFIVEKVSALAWLIAIAILLIIIAVFFLKLKKSKESDEKRERKIIKTPLIRRRIKAPKLP